MKERAESIGTTMTPPTGAVARMKDVGEAGPANNQDQDSIGSIGDFGLDRQPSTDELSYKAMSLFFFVII
jgi:hypothetical protein